MYIWVGINIADQLECLRDRALEIENDIGFARTALDLPLHISLKISFFVEDGRWAEAVEDIFAFYKTLKTGTAETDRIERTDGFVWLRHKENPYLSEIHEGLNELMAEKYGVPRHIFDNEFIYHTTLFTDEDEKKLADAYERIGKTKIPPTIRLSRFLVGLSPDGAWENYKVFREIDLGTPNGSQE